MRISDWSSDVCSSDLNRARPVHRQPQRKGENRQGRSADRPQYRGRPHDPDPLPPQQEQPAQCRSEEHTSELPSLMRISYAVFCWKDKNTSLNDTAATSVNIRRQKVFTLLHTTH